MVSSSWDSLITLGSFSANRYIQHSSSYCPGKWVQQQALWKGGAVEWTHLLVSIPGVIVRSLTEKDWWRSQMTQGLWSLSPSFILFLTETKISSKKIALGTKLLWYGARDNPGILCSSPSPHQGFLLLAATVLLELCHYAVPVIAFPVFAEDPLFLLMSLTLRQYYICKQVHQKGNSMRLACDWPKSDTKVEKWKLKYLLEECHLIIFFKVSVRKEKTKEKERTQYL